jgi:AraC-like DNA-binding protein
MSVFEAFNIEIVFDPGNDPVFESREAHRSHTPYETEKVFFSLVRNGDVAGMRNLLSSFAQNNVKIKAGHMSDSRVRQAQYLAVTFITLAARSAIEGGMPERDAYRLSDAFVREMDGLADANEIVQSCFGAMLALTQAVQNAETPVRYSLPIRRCIDYIDGNLHFRITLDTLAELCGLTPVYLSSLFKKETGVNLSQYILHQKLEQAKKMIRTGQYAYDEISNYLGFCSQSYFIRCFKREYGITPREFKQSSE